MRGAVATLALLASAPAALGGEDLVQVSTAQMPAGERGVGAALGDVDGDGRMDLIATTRRRGSRRGRALLIFKSASARASGLSLAGRLELTPDLVAWAVGDVHPDPGEEIVLFGARGAFAWRTGASDADPERFVLLAETAFLWQLVDPHQAFVWQYGVRDVDGDGLDDLVLPEPNGYRLALQRRTRAGVSFDVSPLNVPGERGQRGAWLAAGEGSAGWRGSRSSAELRMTISVGAGADDDYSLPQPLLTVVESTPAPQLIDWDADGDLDVLAQTRSLLHVWEQGAGGFSDGRRVAFPLPVEADRDRRLDASYSSHTLDINGDGRADCVIFAGDRRSDSVRTQGLIFVQGAGRGDSKQTPEAPLFGPRGRPQDLLVFAGFVAEANFPDFDADGLPDLSVTTVRPDLIDQLRAVSSESIETQVHLYRNRSGRFSPRPDLSWKVALPLKQFRPLVQFVGDVSGDGLSELLVRDAPDRLRLMLVRQPRGRETFEVLDRPLWELQIDKDAQVELWQGGLRPTPEVLVVEPTQVLLVRFG